MRMSCFMQDRMIFVPVCNSMLQTGIIKLLAFNLVYSRGRQYPAPFDIIPGTFLYERVILHRENMVKEQSILLVSRP